MAAAAERFDGTRQFETIIDQQDEAVRLAPYRNFLENFEIDLTEIGAGSTAVIGSDAWLGITMSRSVEQEGILRHYHYFIDQFEGERTLGNELFARMEQDWLRLEYLFYLSENGAGKDGVIPLQPSYYSVLAQRGDELILRPNDLRQFDDQAKGYMQINPAVGDGLYYIYDRLFRGDRGLFIGIVSPTEEYQRYGSRYDVLNFMRVVERDTESEETVIEGKYVVLGRVLTTEQRRFVHNLLGKLGEGTVQLEDLRASERAVLTKAIPTDTLLVTSQEEVNLPEYQWMVRRPNTFTYEDYGEEAIYHFVKELNEIFYARFGEYLVEERDLDMYPVIQEIVDVYQPFLEQALWDAGDGSHYNNLLREMVYVCQARWGILREQDVDEHLGNMAKGNYIFGFEFDFSQADDFSYKLPFGFEAKGMYCEIHKTTYEGDYCPKCQKEFEDQPIYHN